MSECHICGVEHTAQVECEVCGESFCVYPCIKRHQERAHGVHDISEEREAKRILQSYEKAWCDLLASDEPEPEDDGERGKVIPFKRRDGKPA